MELREGSWHGQKEFGYILDRVLPRARKLIGKEGKLLLRLDSGHDAKENRERLIQEEQTDQLIKWNPRKEKAETWLERAEQQKDDESAQWKIEWKQPREGKRIALFSQRITEEHTQPSCYVPSYPLAPSTTDPIYAQDMLSTTSSKRSRQRE